MKKIFFLFLLFVGSFLPAFAGNYPHVLPFDQLAVPVHYSLVNKTTVLYIPGSCSGMINEAVAGEGQMTVSVVGKIQNGQLTASVKLDFRGRASMAVEGITYSINGTMAAAVTTTMFSEPVHIFLNGYLRLENKNRPPLYIGDIGYITVYPDGSVANHLLDPHSNADGTFPKVYCKEPKE